MNLILSDWASVAEIVASIGVILSLIFVGLQVRAGNRETRAATMRATIDSELSVARAFADHAETWAKVVAGESLTSLTERRRGIALYSMLMMESENRYFQFKSGYLDAQTWASRLESNRPIAKLPIYEEWRGSPSALNRSPDFLALMDNQAAGDSAP